MCKKQGISSESKCEFKQKQQPQFIRTYQFTMTVELEIFYLILNLILCLNFGGTTHIVLSGPELKSMPTPMTHFSNTVGLTLTCVGQGPQPLTISWLSGNGEELPPIAGIREQLQNGSLYFSSFKPEDYIPTVHNGEYRCSVRNPVGTFLSPVFNVRAIVDHPFEVMISVRRNSGDMIIEESPALLSCDVLPSFYSQFVRVIAWKSIDQFGHESPITENDRRYKIISDGSLLIFNTKYQQLFACIGQSVLNRKVQSSSAYLLKSRAGGELVQNSKPEIIRKHAFPKEDVNILREKTEETTDLICLLAGNPPLNFRWEKYHKGKFVPVTSLLSTSFVIEQGPLLRLTSVNPSLHNGTYRCEVSNSFGTFTSDYHLFLQSNPVLTIEPESKVLRNGESIELSCGIKTNSSIGANNSVTNASFRWYKNGKPVKRNSAHKNMAYEQKLQIFNAKLEDQGVYQCFVDLVNSSGVSGRAHASTTLIFKSSAPELIHTFISQTIQPGPFVSLKCSAIGNPIPRITWFIDGTLISSIDNHEPRYWLQEQHSRISVGSYQQSNFEIVSHLNISRIQAENSGVYKCEATNVVGMSLHSARLNIYGLIFVKEMGALTLVDGKTALIPCHYGGYPVDKVSWQKNSQDFETTSGESGFNRNGGKGTSGGESRFSIFANGTLKIEKVNRSMDKGQYTCVVSNRKGEIASGSVNINVMRPPVISHFKFDNDLREEQRTSVSCNVISGDLPIDIFWVKGSEPIPSRLNVTENRVKFISVLLFDDLTHEHSGEYICSASNAASTVTQSATLNVKVPPKWLKMPEDAKVVLGSDHLLYCTTNGVPQPTVSWYRESGVGGIKYAIKTNDKFQLMENGGLRISQVEEADASNYICEARNGVGNGISKSIRLHVIIPAKVSARMTSVVVAEGLAALLKCEIRGDPPIQVSWKKDSILIESEPSLSGSSSTTSSRLIQHQTIVDKNSSVFSAELRIDPSEPTDSAFYLCIASNQYGRDEAKINLEVKARPNPPENFMVAEIGSRFIRLQWSVVATSRDDVPVTHFILQSKKSSVSSWNSSQVLNLSVHSPITHVIIESLNPMTNYDVRLFSANDFGRGFPTETLTILTLSEAPSGAPTNVSGIPLGPKVVLVKWEPPNASLQHGEILGYQVIANMIGIRDSSKRINETVVVDQKWELQTELKDLAPNAQYKISVKAYNNAGIGPASSPLFIQTPEGAPDSPPIHLKCEALSPKSLQVYWEPPPFHLSNGQIQGYKIIYLPLEQEKMGEKGEVKKTSNKETTLHGLRSFTSYTVKSLAFTHGGESNMSQPVICRTEEDVPEEPADIKILALSGTSALVSWLPPHHSNGVITKYTVFWKSEESHQVKEKEAIISTASFTEEVELFHELRRLREFHKYSVWVKASTAVGTGKASRVEILELSATIPARIASFSAVKKPELGQSLLLPCKTIGIPSPRVVWFRNNLLLPSHIPSRNGSLFISSVKDEDEGLFTCRAENEHGSDEIEHRVSISRPPSSILIYISYVTDSSIQIHWDSPVKAEPPLTAYFLQYQKQKKSVSSEDWISIRLGPRLTSYSLENLLCGTQYRCRIYGENSVGNGALSEIVKTKTNGHPPELPKLTEILDGNGTMIRIDLTRWSDGGCPITHFNIDYRKVHASTSATWLRVHKRDNSTRVFVIQTQLYSKYEIRITVENDAGSVTKVFSVESHSEFFTNYAKALEQSEKEVGVNESSVPFYADPHVLVPIVSAVICTLAAAICVLMLIKRRRNQSQSEWKFKPSTSQQTWLSTSADGTSKCVDAAESVSSCPETMSIYTTINSTKPIPMTIRDSTVRFHSFGQQDNYEAPPGETIARVSKRKRRKSIASSPVDEMCLQQVSCQMEIEPPTEFRSSLSNPQQQQQLTFHQHNHLVSHKHNIRSGLGPYDIKEIIPAPHATSLPAAEYIDEDGLYHDYSCPYQFITTASDNHSGATNIVKKQLSTSSATGGKSRRCRDASEFF